MIVKCPLGTFGDQHQGKTRKCICHKRALSENSSSCVFLLLLITLDSVEMAGSETSAIWPLRPCFGKSFRHTKSVPLHYIQKCFHSHSHLWG